MNEQEKSVMLARLCGWELVRREWRGALKIAWFIKEERITKAQAIDLSLWGEDLEAMACPNLYDPSNMALAWRVLNWWLDYEFDNGVDIFIRWWQHEILCCEAPAEAQAAWLDKVLELAIEAGMVDVS